MEAMLEFGNRVLPVSQMVQEKAEGFLSRVHNLKSFLVTKDDAPAAVVLSPEDYDMLREELIDQELMIEAMARQKNSEGQRLYTMEEVMEDLGITQADLDAAGDVEIE